MTTESEPTTERWVYTGLRYDWIGRPGPAHLTQWFTRLDGFPTSESHGFKYIQRQPLIPTGTYRPGSIWDVNIRYGAEGFDDMTIIRGGAKAPAYVGLIEDEDQLVRLQAANDAALIEKEKDDRMRKENSISPLDKLLEPLAEEYSKLRTVNQRAAFMARIYQSIITR
jgi:hypothetical protein